MRTSAVVDIITQYLMTFGPLLGDIKKEDVIPSNLDQLSTNFKLFNELLKFQNYLLIAIEKKK